MAPATPIEPHVVILDDDEDSREAFAMFLRMNGFAVDELSTAEEMLESVGGGTPQLLLMDIALGGEIDGYELARRLRGAPISQAIRLVAMTGFSPDAVKAECDLFDAILTKPVDANDLVRVVRELVT